MIKTFEQLAKETEKMHIDMKTKYDERPITGERAAINRIGKEPVDVIIYRPDIKETVIKENNDKVINTGNTDNKRPVFINMHGGGFIGGDAVLLDSFCQLISKKLQAVVFNVNYKKAPEHPFPYAIEEVYDTAVYIAQNAEELGIDKDKIAIGGHSAGASIAEGAVLMAGTEEKVSFVCQVLVYPCTDLDTPINEYDPDCPVNEAEGYNDFVRLYCQNNDSRHLFASPLLARPEELENVCPALFITCELDSLRYAGEAYAKKLIDSGIPVICKRFKGALHGFVEVNRPDYFFNDNRKSEEQGRLCKEAEELIVDQLRIFYK